MRALAIRLFNSKAVRFLFTAGAATVVDVAVYFIFFNFILVKADLLLFGKTLSAPSVSLVISFSCGLITNFFLTKNFVFKGSDLRSGVQFGRFVLVAIGVFFLNYYFMNTLINVFGWFPTIARGFSAITIGVLSFMMHKMFSFRQSS